MDQLEWCIQTYEALLGRNFVFTFETGEVLTLSFQREQAHHLLGLHKLSDLDLVNKKRNNVTKIYKSILNKRIDENYLKKSVHFPDTENRLRYFPLMQGLLTNRTMIRFDPTLVKDTNLSEVRYALFQQVKDGYIHVMLGVKDTSLFPITFLFEQSRRYLTEQSFLNVRKIEIQNYEKSK